MPHCRQPGRPGQRGRGSAAAAARRAWPLPARPPPPRGRIKRPMHCGIGGAHAHGPRRRCPLRRPPALTPASGPAAAPCYQSPPSGAAARGAVRGLGAGAPPAAGRSVVRGGGGDALEHKELATLDDLLGRLPVLNHAPPHLRQVQGEQAAFTSSSNTSCSQGLLLWRQHRWQPVPMLR